MAYASQVPETSAALRGAFGDNPFLALDAASRGISRGQLRAAARTGVVVPLRRGAYALAGPWESNPVARHLLQACAVQLTVPDAVAGHWTAVLAHRLPTPTRSDARPRYPTFVHPQRNGVSAGARFVEGEVDERDRVTVAGLVATSPTRTALDVVADRPLAHALVVLDAACRRIVADRLPAGADLATVLARDSARLDALAVLGAVEGRRTYRTGSRRAATAIALTDPRAESALESWSRAVFLASALPRPHLQLPVHGDSGATYRADFAWPEHLVLGEADGLLKYTDRAALPAEKRREDDLRRAGWTVVRWTWAEIARTPDMVVGPLMRALGL